MGRTKTWIIAVVALLLVGGGGYAAYSLLFAQADVQAEPELQTATVAQGDIVLTALGSGNLLPAREVELVFDADGLVAEVLVEVGDEVQAGDVLARLEPTDLQRAVTEAEIALRQAEINLEAAMEPPDAATLLAAQDAVDQAAAALQLAQISYDGTMSGTLVVETLDEAQEAYDDALERYESWLEEYEEGERAYWYVDRAAGWLEDAELTLVRTGQQVEAEVQSATNDVAQALDQYNQARADLEALLAGADALEVEGLELSVRTAEMNLEVARENLAHATLSAPFAGVVTAVDVQAGETVASSTAAVALADMAAPVMQFWVEEADVGSAVVGNPVSIVFEALPDLTFSGEIIRVEPTLVDVDGVPAVQIWASVDVAAHPVNLLAGMNADVEILAGEARNVLLVPVQALRELGADQYAVFVVSASGELELRPVQVGLMDFVNAAILSGLQRGEVVSTGEAETAESVEIPSAEMPGGGFMFPGGGPR